MRRILASLFSLALVLGGGLSAAAEEPLSSWERFIKLNWNPAQPVETRLYRVAEGFREYTDLYQRCPGSWTHMTGRGLWTGVSTWPSNPSLDRAVRFAALARVSGDVVFDVPDPTPGANIVWVFRAGVTEGDVLAMFKCLLRDRPAGRDLAVTAARAAFGARE